jgi:LPS O-antigen subunit length determinant protein (WzzB/FepE family)
MAFNDSNDTSEYIDDTIDLNEIFGVLFLEKKKIIVSTIISSLVAVVFSLMLPNTYKAETLISPNRINQNSSLSSLASQYGGLASMAGINLGMMNNNEEDKKTLAIETLKSRKFFADYLYEKILIEMMAVDSWDQQNNILIYDNSIFDPIKLNWVRDVSYPRKIKPSLQEAHSEFMSEFFFISEDARTGYITLSVEHLSPYVAKNWLDMIVASINESIRSSDVKRSENSIKFLLEQIELTNQVALDDMFSGLIQEQMTTMMMANISKEYIFRIIDPALVSEKKSSPNRAFIVILSSILGFVTISSYLLITYYRRKKYKVS